MSYLDWKVGDKLVCVDDVNQNFGYVLRAGTVYTIREMVVVPKGYPDTGQIGVRLAEVVLPRGFDGSERAHKATRFRPIQTRKTDISIFQRLLTNPHVRIGEDA